MTKTLEKAFKVASKLPEAEQEALAAAILQELAAEERWKESFGRSEKQLERLADEALDEYRGGRTKPLDR